MSMVDAAASETPDVVPGRRREVMVVLPGLLLAMLLAMLDNMIVSTALPKIVGQLGGLDQISWVVTAYVLGTTVSTPLWGKIGDLYGRKNIFLTSIVVFLIGSALAGMSQTMGQLIGFRALQGLGAGGLIVGVMAIIGDLVPPRERGRYQGFMASVMGAAMIGGPLAGGLITDHLNWRWAFYVNLPLGAVALFLLITRLHLPKHRTEHRIDWLGAGLLSVGITSLVLITSWGGHKYAWGSAQILWLLVLGVAALIAFGLVERRAAEPILSLGLFRNRNFALVSGMGFLLGFAMFGAMNFLPLFQQTVQGESATVSGLMLLPMMLGMMSVSLVVGNLITKTGRYKRYPVIGGAVMSLAVILLAQLDVNTSKVELAAFMVVLGAGMGFLMQTTMLIAQNSVEQKDMGVASSSATFFRSIGGSFGVALFGTIFVRTFNGDLTKSFGPAADKFTHGGGQVDPAALRALPDAIRLPLLHAIADGLGTVFVWAIPFAVLIAVIAVFIKHVPLRGSSPASADAVEGDEAPSALVGAME
jgi:EmrB/QacA subfamily drug resistance transporter